MEKRHKKLQRYLRYEKNILVFVLLICLLVTKTDGGICYTPECINAAHHILSFIDQTVDPCDDFYKFSCGNFLKEVTAKNKLSLQEDLYTINYNALKQIVMGDLDSENGLTKSLQYQRKFYKLCMNTTAIQEDNDKTFLESLKFIIGGWPLYQVYTGDLQWPEVMIKARKEGLRFNFFLDVDIKFYHDDSSVYLEISPPPKSIFFEDLWRKKNIQKIMGMTKYWGDPMLSSNWKSEKTLEFVTELAQIVEEAHNEIRNWTLEERKTTISKLKNLPFLRLDWVPFLKTITNLPNLKDDDIIVLSISEEYLKNLYYLLQKTQSKFWLSYVVILFMSDDCMFLSKKIETTFRDILGITTYYKNRVHFCFHESTQAFKGVAEAEYIRRIVTPEKRKHIKNIITNVKTELESSLQTNEWMDEKTKELSIKLLQNITLAIGGADIVFNETKLEKLLGFDKLQLQTDNVIKINEGLTKFLFNSEFSNFGKSMEDYYYEQAISIPCARVNAFYEKIINMLFLEATIIQTPIYDIKRPEYMNYGSLGSIIGHELTHAVSKSHDMTSFGKKVVSFWSNKTKINYEIERECIIEEYENYMHRLGDKIEIDEDHLKENLADFTGLNLAYRAYQKWALQHGREDQLPGIKYTPNQMFWIMASTYLCQEPKLIDADSPYAVANFRVLGPIRNSPYFGNDFGCPEESTMNPKNKCRIFV